MVAHLHTSFCQLQATSSTAAAAGRQVPKVRKTVVTRIHEAVKAVALCHNVTPVYEDREADEGDDTLSEADQQCQQEVTYQASSPDEVSAEYKVTSQASGPDEVTSQASSPDDVTYQGSSPVDPKDALLLVQYRDISVPMSLNASQGCSCVRTAQLCPTC